MTTRTPRAHQGVALAGGMIVMACLCLAHLPGLGAGLAYLGPALFAFLLLWLGRYPGEKAMLAFIAPSPLRRARIIGAHCPRRPARMPRGGALLAAALAGRAPPLSTGLQGELHSGLPRNAPPTWPSTERDGEHRAAAVTH